jgi:hypothetical protein
MLVLGGLAVLLDIPRALEWSISLTRIFAVRAGRKAIVADRLIKKLGGLSWTLLALMTGELGVGPVYFEDVISHVGSIACLQPVNVLRVASKQATWVEQATDIDVAARRASFASQLPKIRHRPMPELDFFRIS